MQVWIKKMIIRDVEIETVALIKNKNIAKLYFRNMAIISDALFYADTQM